MADRDLARERVVNDLAAYETALRAEEERRREESVRMWAATEELTTLLYELLLRARDAGLRNSDIATALNEGAERRRYSTSAVTAELKRAQDWADRQSKPP